MKTTLKGVSLYINYIMRLVKNYLEEVELQHVKLQQ